MPVDDQNTIGFHYRLLGDTPYGTVRAVRRTMPPPRDILALGGIATLRARVRNHLGELGSNAGSYGPARRQSDGNGAGRKLQVSGHHADDRKPSGPAVRREWDSNPRWVAPHTLSKRADSAALASLLGVPGVGPRTGQAIVCAARGRRWRPGPVQLQPVNRVRAGRQQLSAEPVVCRRSPGRHLGSRALRARPRLQLVAWAG